MKKLVKSRSGRPPAIDAREARIGVTAFKARCLALIDAVERGKTGRVVLMKRGRAVAELRPIARASRELWGALAGTVSVAPGHDLTRPTGEAWSAER